MPPGEIAATLLEALARAFVPLFVAIDVFGIVPIYLVLTGSLEVAERRSMLRTSICVAAAVSVAFVVLGKMIFVLLGITVSDFQIAGGLVLLGLAALDLLSGEPHGTAEGGGGAGVVPLGVPLIAGPALITGSIVLVDLYGAPVTIAALLLNLGVCWLVLAHAPRILRVLGRTGARGISKVVSLLLAAIGVHWIRQGLGG